MFLYGRNSVAERLKANPGSIKKIFLQDKFNIPYIEDLIKLNNIPVEYLPRKELNKIKQADNVQGIIAEINRFECLSFNELLNKYKNKKLSLIFLDRIYDPQNLGSIIRSAACFGEFAIIIPKFKACGITETVLHVSSGGENYIPISIVSNLSNAIISAKKDGYWIVGADIGREYDDITKISLPFPLAVVLGSEGTGIRYGIEKLLDIRVRIPMSGANLSFNVTVACAIFCYEIFRQRRR